MLGFVSWYTPYNTHPVEPKLHKSVRVLYCLDIITVFDNCLLLELYATAKIKVSVELRMLFRNKYFVTFIAGLVHVFNVNVGF